MRKRRTFMITVLNSTSQENPPPEQNSSDAFCGQFKVVSSGKTQNFTNLSELNDLIASEMNAPEDSLEPLPPFNQAKRRPSTA